MSAGLTFVLCSVLQTVNGAVSDTVGPLQQYNRQVPTLCQDPVPLETLVLLVAMTIIQNRRLANQRCITVKLQQLPATVPAAGAGLISSKEVRKFAYKKGV
jgi:hypothetical protein